jgi:hypothetical protein
LCHFLTGKREALRGTAPGDHSVKIADNLQAPALIVFRPTELLGVDVSGVQKAPARSEQWLAPTFDLDCVPIAPRGGGEKVTAFDRLPNLRQGRINLPASRAEPSANVVDCFHLFLAASPGHAQNLARRYCRSRKGRVR